MVSLRVFWLLFEEAFGVLFLAHEWLFFVHSTSLCTIYFLELEVFFCLFVLLSALTCLVFYKGNGKFLVFLLRKKKL